MKKFIAAALAALTFTSCTLSTDHGDCIGAFDEPRPDLVYDTSTWNIVMGVIFFEMIFPPLVVVLTATKCPTGKK